MKVGVIQSNYIPWRGYFDFIDSVDLFVFHDDLQYTKSDWRNRNRILTPAGPRWLTVPVRYKHVDQKIDEVAIDYSQNWAARHIEHLNANYRRAPFFEEYVHQFAGVISGRFESISELNVAACKWIMEVLDIHTPIRMSRELAISGKKSERLIDLLARVGGTTYVSGPSASAYLDLELFQRNGIRVEYKSYDYPEYPQLQAGFFPGVSVLDLLFNKGPEARRYLKSAAPNQVAA
jgi:hypothetical protein